MIKRTPAYDVYRLSETKRTLKLLLSTSSASIVKIKTYVVFNSQRQQVASQQIQQGLYLLLFNVYPNVHTYKNTRGNKLCMYVCYNKIVILQNKEKMKLRVIMQLETVSYIRHMTTEFISITQLIFVSMLIHMYIQQAINYICTPQQTCYLPDKEEKLGPAGWLPAILETLGVFTYVHPSR